MTATSERSSAPQVCEHAQGGSALGRRLVALLPGWARMPAGLADRLRWLFTIQAVLALLLTIPLVVDGPRGAAWPSVVAAAAVLVASWATAYRRRRSPAVLDVLDAAGLLYLAMFSSQPGYLLPVVFAVLWFRSQDGSLRRDAVRVGLFTVALAAAVVMAPMSPGHPGPVPLVALVGAIPTMLLMVMVGHFLAATVRARERITFLEAVQGDVAAQLLGTTDEARIRQIEWTAIAQVGEVTPGLRVLTVATDGGELTVLRAAGQFAQVPSRLPGELLAELEQTRCTLNGAMRRCAVLDAMAGQTCGWACVALPEVDDPAAREWLLIGTPQGVPLAELVPIENLTNQVTLALRNSAVHRRLTTLARLDGLTGVLNRAAFIAALSDSLTGGANRQVAVLFIDLDDFKDVNDGYGHHAGDEVLRAVAVRLRAATRPGDLCARIGGDEFAVLLADTGEAVAEEIAVRVVDAIAEPCRLGEVTVRVGGSVGVATGRGVTDPETLLHRADVAMYAAKAHGKAQVQVFGPSFLRGDRCRNVVDRAVAASTDGPTAAGGSRGGAC